MRAEPAACTPASASSEIENYRVYGGGVRHKNANTNESPRFSAESRYFPCTILLDIVSPEFD